MNFNFFFSFQKKLSYESMMKDGLCIFIRSYINFSMIDIVSIRIMKVTKGMWTNVSIAWLV